MYEWSEQGVMDILNSLGYSGDIYGVHYVAMNVARDYCIAEPKSRGENSTFSIMRSAQRLGFNLGQRLLSRVLP
jgi:hypothetical protein